MLEIHNWKGLNLQNKKEYIRGE